MIDVFNRERFEQALPQHETTGLPLWVGLGLRGGAQPEYCYTVQVKPGVLIYIRSSVRANGWCAAAAKDSIRCWLASDATGRSISSKDQRWITRMPGWEERLAETLRKLWILGDQLEHCPNHPDPVLMHARKVIKETKNKGKWFQACPNCGQFYDWLQESI